MNGTWSFRRGLDKRFYDKYLNDFTPIFLRFWNLADILRWIYAHQSKSKRQRVRRIEDINATLFELMKTSALVLSSDFLLRKYNGTFATYETINSLCITYFITKIVKTRKERFNCEDINSIFVWDNAKTHKSIEIHQLIKNTQVKNINTDSILTLPKLIRTLDRCNREEN